MYQPRFPEDESVFWASASRVVVQIAHHANTQIAGAHPRIFPGTRALGIAEVGWSWDGSANVRVDTTRVQHPIGVYPCHQR